MKKSILLSASLISMVFCSVPVMAQMPGDQGALNSGASPGTQGGYGHSSWRFTETPWDYQQVDSPGHAGIAPQGWANTTLPQGAGSPNGPKLFGTSGKNAGPFGQSGAATAAPFQGTYFAPGSFALRQQGRFTLPPTELTSIIRDSGMSFSTYGDEGTNGPPPLSDFTTIDGGLSDQMTTGHQSDAPSAWGYPQ